MSKSQRTKGASGERELCALLSDAFGSVVKRKLGQARDSGNDIDLPPYRIEVKRRKRIAGLYDWIKQAVDDKARGAMRVDDDTVWVDGHIETTARIETPVLACRADGKDWLIVMRFRDWVKLAREEIAKD